MTLDWTFSFVEIIPNMPPKIELVCSYRNGKSQFIADALHFPEVIHQLEAAVTLIGYIAFFPNKDFTKINLSTVDNQTAVHFLDKRHLADNFLGILSVSEMNQETIFELWGIEEMMTEFVVDYYRDMKASDPSGELRVQDFHEWLNVEIADFFQDWKEAKDKTPPRSVSMGLKSYWGEEKKERDFEQWWDIQLINEYGEPLTDLISFIDETPFFVNDESEKVSQSLESMSLSALKILIDQQGGWNIRYIKNKLNNNMGYAYSFFEKFQVQDVKYLLILNSAVYDYKTSECLQIFRGNEFKILEAINGRLANHTLFFTTAGQLRPENKDLLHRIILNCIESLYT